MVSTLIEILLVVLICYVAWGLINAAILRRMRAEMPEAEADDEDVVTQFDLWRFQASD